MLAYLPMAWIGEHIFSYAQAYCAGFCASCPESRRHGDGRPARARADLFLRTAADLREHPDPGDDPHGGRRAGSSAGCSTTSSTWRRRVGPALLDGQPVGVGDRAALLRSATLLVYGPLKNTLGISRIRVAYTAGEAIGPDLFTFYRSLGINLKQLYGMTESSVFLCIQKDGGGEARHRRRADRRRRDPHRRGRRGACSAARALSRLLQEPRGDRRGEAAGRLGPHRRRRILRRRRAAEDHRPGEGCRAARRTARCSRPKFIENKLKFFPYIKEAVAFGDGRAVVAAFINIDLEAVGDWAEHFLKWLSRIDIGQVIPNVVFDNPLPI